MAYEKKDGEISVFENDKQGNEKRPDFKGSALIDGKEYEVALWKRQTQAGKNFIAGTIKVMEKKEQQNKEEVKMEDDVIPW